MNKEESLLDDETLFFGYFKEIIAGRGESFGSITSIEYANSADFAVEQHRKRFPRRNNAHKQG